MTPSLDRPSIRNRLERVRGRTLALIAPLDWPALRRQHVEILSPMVWDLGHIGNFEEQWLGRELAGGVPLHDHFQKMFDPVANPRPTREVLPLPERRELFEYLDRVRESSLQILADCNGAPEELLAEGFVYEMVCQHEEQHQETLLQAIQLMTEPPYVPGQRRRRPARKAGALPEEMIHIPTGPFLMGRDRPGFAYDNENRVHEVDLKGFLIDAAPVTNGEVLAFVEGGGYERREFWSEAGRRWKKEADARAPQYWARSAGGKEWRRRCLGVETDLVSREPVIHVSYYEAEAYAAFAGKRLPTEAEWEKAALWDETAGRQRLYPWGDEAPTPERANLDQLAFGPAETGAYPAGASAYGVHQMAGDVWEWTSSDFLPYPGFRAFPYDEYSKVFFGDEYKVLRGGSWATRPAVARGTFRNWDYPIRRQIFAGLRCARDD